MELVLLLCWLAYASAQGPVAQSYPDVIPILSYTNDNNYDGSYKYSYETGNGISVQEEGFLKNPGQEELEAQTARGSYTYTAPNGQVITVNWYADETGFHPEGPHIPKGSPVAVVPGTGVVRPLIAGAGIAGPLLPRSGVVRPLVPRPVPVLPGRAKPVPVPVLPEQGVPFDGPQLQPQFFKG